MRLVARATQQVGICLLYTSDAADERSSVDLGGRRIIKKKNIKSSRVCSMMYQQKQNSKTSVYEIRETSE